MTGMGQGGTGGGGGPRILLAKPANARVEGGNAVPGGGVMKLMRDRDEDSAARTRLPHGSLNLLSDNWDFHSDRYAPLMSDNTDFLVVGVIGPPGVGKSTIMNELYGFDGTTSGVLPPFSVQGEDARAAARHCSIGIELRMSSERVILLDCQPVFSASVLVDLMRSDGLANVTGGNGDSLSAELIHEVIGLQVEMLKQGIPDPSTLASAASGQAHAAPGADRDDSGLAVNEVPEYFSDVVFVHNKLRKLEQTWPETQRLGKLLSSYFPNPAFRRNSMVRYRPPQFSAEGWHSTKRGKYGVVKGAPRGENGVISLSGLTPAVSNFQDRAGPGPKGGDEAKLKNQDELDGASDVNFFVLPLKGPDELSQYHHESYTTMLSTLRNQILCMTRRSFLRPLSERDWLRNAARMWDLVKRSPVLADYTKFLQSSGLYRR